MKNLKLIIFTLLMAASIAYGQKNNTVIRQDGHPAWIMQGNVYEVNVRQYTPEGTFKAFAKHLDRLKKMGVQTLWFMPVNPISKVERKGTMGSYYAVADYTAVNPEFGTMDEWKKLVKAIHARGMKVIIDWVPNHAGADHRWLTRHPDFFIKDSAGNAAIPFDWTDTRQLDYNNTAMQDSMIAAMKFWITNTGIDGFRQDVAWNVPASFWKKCNDVLLKLKPGIFLLAEGDKAYLHPNGFDATYPWEMFHKMVQVAAGERPAFALDSIKAHYDTVYPKNGLLLYFTSNHDENSWNKSDYATFPGVVHAPFAVFTQTMHKSVPLVYSGQEEPVLRPLQFFEKDPIEWNYYKREKFYTTLQQLRKRNPALSANASFKKIIAGDENSVYAYVRQKGNSKVLVILNLSANEQTIRVMDKTLWGTPYNLFMGNTEKLNANPWKIEPWGYVVYEYGRKL
ncbi:MAG TPA: alpha-amylase family glycosyl hydrolase [Ferruginibacter sp.]|nr:alpha-amylase family glycosyl hydrolase [Ferruginibacter sp.]HMP21930.1 alpha-amylase family glycosyl hydrolase [Ferruginibacter sp.]